MFDTIQDPHVGVQGSVWFDSGASVSLVFYLLKVFQQ